jgi:hypothetical protein
MKEYYWLLSIQAGLWETCPYSNRVLIQNFQYGSKFGHGLERGTKIDDCTIERAR